MARLLRRIDNDRISFRIKFSGSGKTGAPADFHEGVTMLRMSVKAGQILY